MANAIALCQTVRNNSFTNSTVGCGAAVVMAAAELWLTPWLSCVSRETRSGPVPSPDR